MPEPSTSLHAGRPDVPGELRGSPAHRRSGRGELVWHLLVATLDDQTKAAGRAALDVVDAGGGTGHLAVPIARLGHTVTVVDPSPDSLAALERRAREADVTPRVRAVQGDAHDLGKVVGAEVADVVLCHNVLEVVDDPAASLSAIATVLRPGGVLSLVAANRHAVVLAKVLGGHVGEALAVLTGHPDGPPDIAPQRFTAEELRAAVDHAGLHVVAEHGIRIFSDLVPGSVAAEPGELEALTELERVASALPTFRAIAGQIHLLVRRP